MNETNSHNHQVIATQTENALQSKRVWFTIRLQLNLLIIGLGILMLLTVGSGYFALNQVLSDAPAINISGSERMRAFQLAVLAHKHHELTNPLERTTVINSIQNEIIRFESFLGGLENGSEELGLRPTTDTTTLSHLEGARKEWLIYQKHLQNYIAATAPETESQYLESLTNHSFVVVAEIDKTVSAFEAQAQVTARQSKSLLLGSLAFSSLIAFAIFFTIQKVLQRLEKLKKTAELLGSGDLTARASVGILDEIGVLATSFNKLSTRLHQMIENLEKRVEERTEDLEKRSSYLQGAAEVSRAVASLTDLKQLSHQIVTLTRQHFDLYYVGLFLVDEQEKWAILNAGTGKAGEIMLANNHRIKIGEGMVGWAVQRGEPRIALDVGEDAVQFKNPTLPNTRSEGALPLRSRGRVLGALTIQSQRQAAFTPEIITILQTMADQIATAFDNAELFAKSKIALEAERRAYGILSQEAWREIIQETEISSYGITEDGKPHIISNQENLKEREKVVIEQDGFTAFLPIKIRNQVLGGIQITKDPEQGVWSQEEIGLAETLAEQFSISLESARLFTQSQRRAARERVIGEASSRIRETLDIESVLKTAAQELHKILGEVETEVWIDAE